MFYLYESVKLDRMAATEAYKSKFPPTKLLDACYSDVVPDKSARHTNVQLLENDLSENSKLFLLMPINSITHFTLILQRTH